MLQRVCRRMVDLPMPGSPPISTTEPSTRPPPSTRSSSADAVEKRGISSTLTSARVLMLACCPAQPPRPEAGLVRLSTTVSTRVFQAPQSAHCPAHFGKVAPHSVQPYMRLALAMEGLRQDKARIITRVRLSGGLTPLTPALSRRERGIVRRQAKRRTLPPHRTAPSPSGRGLG
ncbi:hypothetical protein D3C76_604330 [compost metagenome]